ncbi:hypothetical protein D3C86_1936000 [compost metagenome]
MHMVDCIRAQAAEHAVHANVLGHALQRQARVFLQLGRDALSLPVLTGRQEQAAGSEYQQ